MRTREVIAGELRAMKVVISSADAELVRLEDELAKLDAGERQAEAPAAPADDKPKAAAAATEPKGPSWRYDREPPAGRRF